MVSTLQPSPCQCREKAERFSEYVRLHATKGKLISWEDERTALKAGVADFGLTLDQAKGALYSVADDRAMALESDTRQAMRVFLAQRRKKETISRVDFDDAVRIYQSLTHNTLPETEARKRVKEMVECDGIKARRDWRRLGSRRWYDRV